MLTCPNRFCAQLYERLLDIFLCLYEITFISWHCFPNTFINVTDHVRKQYDSICAMCAPVTPAIKNVTQGKENGRNGKLLEKTPHEQLLKPSTYCCKSLWYVLWMWERVPWKGPSLRWERQRTTFSLGVYQSVQGAQHKHIDITAIVLTDFGLCRAS